MTGTVYYTATSLDGYIATDDHSLDWLVTRQIDGAGPFGYDAFIGGIGALAMGANTYRWILQHSDDGGWMYDVPCWVFTHRTMEPVPGADIRFTEGDVGSTIGQMTAVAGDRRIWVVGGGDLAGQFADRGLLDEVVVFTAPVTLGSGAPLLPRRQELRLVESAVNGEFLAARFRVLPAAG